MATTEEMENEILAEMTSDPDAYSDGPINDIIIIDAESRTINIPASESRFGVEFDKDVERKYFKCQKIVGDNIDLSTHKIYISYITSDAKGMSYKGEPGLYFCEDMVADGDYITFSWLLSGNVFTNPGFIAFKVLAKFTDGENLKTRWNTTAAIGTVLMTVPDGDEIVERYPDIITQLLKRMESVEAIATPEAMQGYVDEYLKNNPQSGMTADEKAQLDKNTNDISKLSEEIADLKENGTGTVSGLTTNQVNALDNMFKKSVFTGDITAEYDAFKTAFGIGGSTEPDTPIEPDNPEVTLASISATYTGGDVVVGTSVNSLTGITVKAHYSDGTSKTVSGYTLSGTIIEGNNTITVSYGGKSTTFTVTGVAESGGNDSSEELMSESNIVATGYTIAKNVQYSFYQLTVKEDVNVYEIPVESGVTYEATITNNNQYGTPYWDDKTMTNVNANTTFAISPNKFTDFSTTNRVTVTLDGNTELDLNMTNTPNGDGTYTRRITFTPAINGYLYADNRTSVNGNTYSIKKVVA